MRPSFFVPILLTALSVGASACTARRTSVTAPRPTPQTASSQPAPVSVDVSPAADERPAPGGTFDRPDLGIRLAWPDGWATRKSEEYELVLVPSPARGRNGAEVTSISLDVPDLPPHIPNMIPIGQVRKGYLDDLRKAVGALHVEDLSPPSVGGATARFVRCTWADKQGRADQETALLMVHADHVYILRARSPADAEPETRAAFDAIVKSMQWKKK